VCECVFVLVIVDLPETKNRRSVGNFAIGLPVHQRLCCLFQEVHFASHRAELTHRASKFVLVLMSRVCVVVDGFFVGKSGAAIRDEYSHLSTLRLRTI
jgi:hypothetical protein